MISYLYASQSSSKKADTDLLLQVLNEVKLAAARLQECSVPCHCGRKLSALEKTQIIWAEREVSHAIYSFDKAIEHCGTTAPDLELDKLKVARAELKDSLTDSPYPGPYDDQAKYRISSAFRGFRDELNRLAFVVVRRR